MVFTGNLSLVGPRPHALHAKAKNRLYDEAVDGYFARHRVKPGITGWAQIHGWRGETDSQEKIQRRVEHDLYYIEKLVDPARPLHRGADAVRPYPLGERLLNSVRAATPGVAAKEHFAPPQRCRGGSCILCCSSRCRRVRSPSSSRRRTTG